MPFKIKDNTTFSLSFLIATFSMFSVTLIVSVIQVIIADLCLNITACYKDIQILFGQLDEIADGEILKKVQFDISVDFGLKLKRKTCVISSSSVFVRLKKKTCNA